MRTENLDYPIDPMKAQRPIKGEKAKKELRRDTKMWNSWLQRWSKGLWVKESRSPLEAEKDHALDSPLELPLETRSYKHLDICLRFWTFRMPRQTVFSHCGHGNLLQKTMAGGQGTMSYDSPTYSGVLGQESLDPIRIDIFCDKTLLLN